jgi:hypothetical protein
VGRDGARLIQSLAVPTSIATLSVCAREIRLIRGYKLGGVLGTKFSLTSLIQKKAIGQRIREKNRSLDFYRDLLSASLRLVIGNDAFRHLSIHQHMRRDRECVTMVSAKANCVVFLDRVFHAPAWPFFASQFFFPLRKFLETSPSSFLRSACPR